MGEAIMGGVRFCLSSRPVSRVLLRGMLFGFGVTGFQALLPVVVRSQLHGDQIDYGLEVGVFGFGSVASALFVSRLRRRFGSEAVVGASTVVCLAAQLLLSVSHSLAPALIAALVCGMGWVAVLTSLNVAIQLRSPEAILARCLSIYQAVAFGAMALGAWAWGVLADQVGLVASMRLAALWLALTLVMRLVAPMPGPKDGRIEHVEHTPEPA